MPRHRACSSLASLVPLALPWLWAAGGASDRRLDDEALAPLAGSLAAYAEARASGLGVDEARAAIERALLDLSEAAGGGHPLRFTSELCRAFWLARGYGEEGAKKGKVATEALRGGSFGAAGLELAYRIPKAYDPARAYPLIVAIPDAGEGPPEHIRLHWTLRAIEDEALLVCPAMPADQEAWDRVTVNGRPGGLSHVLTALRVASQRFAVDFDRVYVVGHGKGVPAALAAGEYGPQRFAGVVGRGGDASDRSPDNFGNLPTYFAGGGPKARAFEAAAREAGFDSLVDLTGDEEDVWEWIQAHPRRTSPSRVTVVPGDPFPTRAYWLRVAPSAPDATATATLEREANTIRIQGHGVTQATLYLHDELVDLDRPIHVFCNEIENTVVVARSLPDALEMMDEGTSDPACAYVAEAVFDMTGAAPPRTLAGGPARDAELDERRAAAAGDVERLWELHEWCASTGRELGGRGALHELLRIAPDHEPARAALGHRRAAEQWFTSPEALERFLRSQDGDVARAKGRVQYKSLWMHPDERAHYTKGWVKDLETGVWLSASDRQRLADGWVLQDLAWIPPEDAARVDAGLWRVDGQWLDLESAERRRARIDTMWRIPTAEVLLHSTTDRAVALRAAREMRRAIEDMRRVFGTEPVLPLRVALLRDEEQYDRLAAGDPDGRRSATHAGRLHVVPSAFFAESWFEHVAGSLEFRGMGVGYWDALAPHGDLYGVHAARLAAGLSYVDALDPSPKAVRKALADGPGGGHYEAYLAEKQLPAWLRHGGAVYAERYFRDDSVGPEGNAFWARDWSLDNLRARGGLRSLAEILEFPIDPDRREDSQKLLIEAGLVVAFVVDGSSQPVRDAHGELKQALAAGRLHPRHVEALTGALAAHESELRAFAGF